MSETQRAGHQAAHADSTTQAASDAVLESAKESRAQFTSHGELPEVTGGASAGESSRELTASDRAFGAGARAHAAAAAHVAPFAGGEPLPKLKELFFAPVTKANVHVFRTMMEHAPVRHGTHIRTPLSPQDGLAVIITAFVLRLCQKYMPFSEKQDEADHAFLKHTLSQHLTLLDTREHGGHSGGHLTHGIDGKLDALVGPSTPYQVVTVNQTAITLLTLERLHENPDPIYHAGDGKKVEHLIKLITPEFKREVLRYYPPHTPPHQWHYGSSSRLEDQSHLKTSWDQLHQLGQTQSKEAAWYKAQADRIAHAWPRAKGSWDGLSNTAGSVH